MAASWSSLPVTVRDPAKDAAPCAVFLDFLKAVQNQQAGRRILHPLQDLVI